MVPAVRAVRCAVVMVCGLWLSTAPLLAESLSFTNLLARGDQAGRQGEVTNALKLYSAAAALRPTNCADLCVLTKRYCDLMHDTTSPAMQKTLAERALATALRAVKADPQSATAHLCVAVCYAKNFPDADAKTKVEWSRAIKSECDTAIALDPKQDVGYYLLGRWNYGVANMNFLVRGLVKIIYGGLPAASNEAAIRDFQKAIALAPNRIIDHLALAKVYETTGQEQLALAELKQCRELKPLDRDDADARQEAEAKLKSLGQ